MSINEPKSITPAEKDARNEWVAQHVRLTYFSDAPEKLFINLGRLLQGNPIQTQSAGGVDTQIFDYAAVPGAALIFQQQAGRRDIILSAGGRSDDAGYLSNIGSPRDALESLVRSVLPIVDSSAPIKRIAVAGALVQQTKTDQEAIEILVPFLPLLRSSDNASEFSYQINRPETIHLSKSKELIVNKLIQFRNVQFAAMVATVSGFVPSAGGALAERRAALRGFDVNTDKDIRLLPTRSHRKILLALQGFANTIIDKGDLQ